MKFGRHIAKLIKNNHPGIHQLFKKTIGLNLRYLPSIFLNVSAFAAVFKLEL